VRGLTSTLVIIPAYNEEKNLPMVLEGLKRLQRELDIDILVVDDGSQDRTYEVARAHGVMVIRHERNMGVEAAIQTGFKYAIERGYLYTVKIDADGQHDPSDVPKLLRPLVEGVADVTIGVRTAGYRELLLFKLGRLASSALIGFFLRRWLRDPTSGFKGRNLKAVALSRALYDRTKFLHDDTVNDIEENILYLRSGLRVVDVPVKMREREAPSKCYFSFRLMKYPLKLLISVLIASLVSVKNVPF